MNVDIQGETFADYLIQALKDASARISFHKSYYPK